MAVVDTDVEGTNGELELELFLKDIDLGKDHENILNAFKNDDITMEDILNLQSHQIEFSIK